MVSRQYDYSLDKARDFAIANAQPGIILPTLDEHLKHIGDLSDGKMPKPAVFYTRFSGVGEITRATGLVPQESRPNIGLLPNGEIPIEVRNVISRTLGGIAISSENVEQSSSSELTTKSTGELITMLSAVSDELKTRLVDRQA